MTIETMKKLKMGDIVYVACKVDAVFINGGMIQVSTRDCNEGFDAYEDEVLEPSEDCISREEAIKQIQRYGVGCFDADDFSVEQCTRFVIGKLNELDSVESEVEE